MSKKSTIIFFLIAESLILIWFSYLVFTSLDRPAAWVFNALLDVSGGWGVISNIKKLRKLSNENYDSIAHTDN